MRRVSVGDMAITSGSPPQIAASTGMGSSVGNDAPATPEQNPDFSQGVAPGGLYFDADLPVDSGPFAASVNGYSATDAQAPLPPPGSGIPPYSGK